MRQLVFDRAGEQGCRGIAVGCTCSLASVSSFSAFEFCDGSSQPRGLSLLVRGSFISAPYVTAIALPPPRVTDNTLRPLGPVSTGPHSAARRAENRITTHDTTHTHVLRRTCSGRISNSMSLVSHSTLMQLLSPGLSPCGAHTTGRAVAQSPEGHDGPHPHPPHAMTRPRPVTSPRID